MAASDEFFAEKENLVKPGAAGLAPSAFGHKGQMYDGWETRRRRGADGPLPGPGEHDRVIVRPGAPQVTSGRHTGPTGRRPPAARARRDERAGFPRPTVFLLRPGIPCGGKGIPGSFLAPGRMACKGAGTALRQAYPGPAGTAPSTASTAAAKPCPVNSYRRSPRTGITLASEKRNAGRTPSAPRSPSPRGPRRMRRPAVFRSRQPF